MSETTCLRWFEAYPRCAQCGKRGDGILRGDTNQSYGTHCTKCADRRLKASEAARKAKGESA